MMNIAQVMSDVSNASCVVIDVKKHGFGLLSQFHSIPDCSHLDTEHKGAKHLVDNLRFPILSETSWHNHSKIQCCSCHFSHQPNWPSLILLHLCHHGARQDHCPHTTHVLCSLPLTILSQWPNENWLDAGLSAETCKLKNQINQCKQWQPKRTKGKNKKQCSFSIWTTAELIALSALHLLHSLLNLQHWPTHVVVLSAVTWHLPADMWTPWQKLAVTLLLLNLDRSMQPGADFVCSQRCKFQLFCQAVIAGHLTDNVGCVNCQGSPQMAWQCQFSWSLVTACNAFQCFFSGGCQNSWLHSRMGQAFSTFQIKPFSALALLNLIQSKPKLHVCVLCNPRRVCWPMSLFQQFKPNEPKFNSTFSPMIVFNCFQPFCFKVTNSHNLLLFVIGVLHRNQDRWSGYQLASSEIQTSSVLETEKAFSKLGIELLVRCNSDSSLLLFLKKKIPYWSPIDKTHCFVAVLVMTMPIILRRAFTSCSYCSVIFRLFIHKTLPRTGDL